MMIGLNRPDFAWHGDMHSNLSLMLFHSYQINTAKGILDTILNIQPKEGSSMGGETREAVVNRLCQGHAEQTAGRLRRLRGETASVIRAVADLGFQFREGKHCTARSSNCIEVEPEAHGNGSIQLVRYN